MNQKVKPSRLFYVVGMIMMITAIVIIAVNVIVTLNQLNLQKRLIKIPGINTVVLEEIGDYIAYYEAEAIFEEEAFDTSQEVLPEIRVAMNRLRSEEAYPFEVVEGDGADFIFFNTGNPVIKFTIKEPGAYVLDMSYVTHEGPDVIVNVTKDNIDELNADLRNSIYLGFGLVGLGLMGIIGTFIARLWFMKRHYDSKKFKEEL